eukprot:PhM_4_TR18439/c0_g1_i2/m.20196
MRGNGFGNKVKQHQNNNNNNKSTQNVNNKKNETGGSGSITSQEEREKQLQHSRKLQGMIIYLEAPDCPTAESIEAEDEDTTGDGKSGALQSYTNLGTMEKDAQFITATETLRYLRQYVMRSLTAAAHHTKSVIVTAAQGDLARTLGEGCHLVNQHIPEGDEPDVRVIGVTTTHQKREESFTNNVIVFSDKEYAESGGHDVEPTTIAKVHETARSLVLELNRGFFGLKEKYLQTAMKLISFDVFVGHPTVMGQPPDRPSVPVVVALFGGDVVTAKYELTLAVEKEWPIFVFDGSGGYADFLAACLRKADASLDDNTRYTSFVSTLDPITAEILHKGTCLLVKKADVVDSVTQAIECSLYGDETLRQAWARYALWTSNMRKFRRIFNTQMFAILTIGILATGISIFQTFVQLTFPEDTKSASDASSMASLYTALNVIVIFLPILMQLMQTISNRMNAGAKFVTLRWASEKIAREIYTYRTMGLEYSEEAVLAARRRRQCHLESNEEQRLNLQEAIEAHWSGMDGGAQTATIPSSKMGGKDSAAMGRSKGGRAAANPDDDDVDANSDDKELESYETRQELLHVRLSRITADLAESDFADTTLTPYNGPLPPLDIQTVGDDGFTDLTPDEYVRFRLVPRMLSYIDTSHWAQEQRTRLHAGVHLFNTLGTVLAALATYESVRRFNLQAWVAFTTALVGALSRYEHMLMLDWLQSKCNRCHMELSNVLSWWSSRGSMAETNNNRDELLERTEDIITNEVTEFRKQVKSSLEKAKELADDMQNMKESAVNAAGGNVSAEDKAYLAKVKEFDLNSLNLSSLSNVLTNPTSAQSKKVIRALQSLNKDMGDVITAAKIRAQRVKVRDPKNLFQAVSDIEEVLQVLVDDSGCLRTTIKHSEMKMYMPRVIFEIVREERRRQQFFKEVARQCPKNSPLSLTRSTMLSVGRAIDRRFETQIRRMPQRLALEAFRMIALEDLFHRFTTSLDGLGLSEYDFIETRDGLVKFISEMKSLATLPWRYMVSELLIAVVKDDMLRFKLNDLSENKLRNVLKRSQQILVDPSTQLRLLDAVEDHIADLDVVNMLLESEDARIQMIYNVSVRKYDFNVIHLSRDELLEHFPAELHEQLETVDVMLLRAYLERLQEGMPGTHLVMHYLDAQRRRAEGIPSSVLKILNSVKRRECFLIATKPFTQLDVIRLGKPALAKRLNNCLFIDEKMYADIRMCKENELRSVLSGILSMHSVSYAGRIFDLLGDEMTSVDLVRILDFEEQLLLLKRINVFRGLDLRSLDRMDILSIIGYRRIGDKLKSLHTYQLREMIERTVRLMNNSLNVNVFFKTIRKLAGTSSRHRRVMETWEIETIDRIVRAVVRLDHVATADETPTMDALLSKIGDTEVKLTLRRSGFTPKYLWPMFSRIKENYGDALTAYMFEAVGRIMAPDPVLYAVFDRVFTNPNNRDRFLFCLCNIVKANPLVLNLSVLTAMSSEELAALMLKGSGKHQATLTSHVDLLRREFQEEFVDIVTLSFSVFVVSSGYHMTHTIADDISSFAVRGIIRGLHSRVLMPPLVTLLTEYGDAKFNDAGECISSKSDIFNRFDDLQDFRAATNDLSALPDDMIQALFTRYRAVITQSRVGHFFKHCNKAMEQLGMPILSSHRRWAFHIGVTTLRNHIKTRSVQVQADFDNFESRFFVTRMENERVAIFNKYISSNRISRFLGRFTEPMLNLLFSYLRVLRVYRAPRRKVLNRQRRRRPPTGGDGKANNDKTTQPADDDTSSDSSSSDGEIDMGLGFSGDYETDDDVGREVFDIPGMVVPDQHHHGFASGQESPTTSSSKPPQLPAVSFIDDSQQSLSSSRPGTTDTQQQQQQSADDTHVENKI